MAIAGLPSPTSTAPLSAPVPARSGGAADVRQEAAAVGNNTVTNVAAVAPRPAASETVNRAAVDVADYIQTANRSLQIAVDRELGSTIITVVDKATDQVIRQIPQEEIVALSRFIAQQRSELAAEGASVKGLLMDAEG